MLGSILGSPYFGKLPYYRVAIGFPSFANIALYHKIMISLRQPSNSACMRTWIYVYILTHM